MPSFASNRFELVCSADASQPNGLRICAMDLTKTPYIVTSPSSQTDTPPTYPPSCIAPYGTHLAQCGICLENDMPKPIRWSHAQTCHSSEYHFECFRQHCHSAIDSGAYRTLVTSIALDLRCREGLCEVSPPRLQQGLGAA